MLSLLCATSTLAVPVGLEQARQTAVQFVQQHFPAAQPSSLHRAATRLQPVTDDVDAPFYVFNIGQQQGFVIVSGDDRTVPVLGYTDHGDFDLFNMPDNMRSFLQEYAEAIALLRKLGLPAARQQSRRAEERADVEPLVKVSYNQRAPYWSDTPLLDYGGRKNHGVTGCVATAMAQVMATHRHPARTTAEIPAYQFTFNGSQYDMPAIAAESEIHWDLIADTYDETYSGNPDEDAVASLMKMCGAATEMQYGVNESGGSQTSADKAAAALVRYFDYEERTVRLVFRRNYSTTNWENMIYGELQAGRPIIYSGLSADNGHSFVCDGYKAEDDTYHINWGWGGLADGYYVLSLLNPQNLGTGGGTDLSGYSMAHAAIIGIQPNDDTVTPDPAVLTVNYIFPQNYKSSFSRAGDKDDFTGLNVVYETFNWTDRSAVFDVGLRVIDSEGNTVQEIADPQAQGRLIYQNTRWNTVSVSASYAVPVTISGSLPDGNYRIIATSRIAGSGDMNPDKDADSRFIAFNIVGNSMYVTEMYKEPVFGLRLFKDIEIQPVTEGETMVGKLHQAKVVLMNDGTIFRDDIFYTLNEVDPESTDKVVTYAAYADLAEGESHVYTFYFKPNREGVNTIRVYANDDWGSPHLLGTQTVTVSGAPDIHIYVTGVENYDAEQGAVLGNTLTMTVKAVNEGSVAFEGRYDWYLSYSTDEGVSWIDIQNSYPTFFNAFGLWNLTLGPGESEEKVLTWTNLDYSRYHRVLFAKYNDGYYYNNEMIRTEEYRLVDPSTIKKMGDINGDGEVNALDIQLIINACVADSEEEDYDINKDGRVDGLDIQTVINVSAASAGE